MKISSIGEHMVQSTQIQIDAARDRLDLVSYAQLISEKCGCNTAFAVENINLGKISAKIDLKSEFVQKLT